MTPTKVIVDWAFRTTNSFRVFPVMKKWQWMASTTESTLVIQLHLKLAEQ
jgi:hypothetical protein